MEQGPDELSDRTMEGVEAGEGLDSGDAAAGSSGGPTGQKDARGGAPGSVEEGSEESFPASDPPSETIPAE